MPVALATIACSKETFVPSAKLVTMYGSCPHCGEPFLGRRGAEAILQTLDVAEDQRVETDAGDESMQVEFDPGLVAVDPGEHQPAESARLEQRAHRAVELGIHRHDVLAGGEGGQA